MIPQDPDELDNLAGEYVLGTLEGEARREVEAALPAHVGLRAAIADWEERLHGLAANVAPADPPAQSWDRIASRLGASPVALASSSQRSSARLWRGATALASAVAALLLVYIVAAPTSGPSYVAVLHAPQEQGAAWVATAGAAGLLLHAVAVSSAPSERSYELWAIAPGAKQPQSLGVIPPDGRLSLGTLPATIHDGAVLAISIEPKSGSPTGQPTGPIVFTGTLVATQ
jgi:anti-sigma-K factor RskA